jgi:hypothetical protein
MGLEQSVPQQQQSHQEQNPEQNNEIATTHTLNSQEATNSEPSKKYVEPQGTKIEIEPTDVEAADDVVKKPKKTKQSKQQTPN